MNTKHRPLAKWLAGILLCCATHAALGATGFVEGKAQGLLVVSFSPTTRHAGVIFFL